MNVVTDVRTTQRTCKRTSGRTRDVRVDGRVRTSGRTYTCARAVRTYFCTCVDKNVPTRHVRARARDE